MVSEFLLMVDICDIVMSPFWMGMALEVFKESVHKREIIKNIFISGRRTGSNRHQNLPFQVED